MHSVRIIVMKHEINFKYSLVSLNVLLVNGVK